MKIHPLIQWELDRISWSTLRISAGRSATNIPVFVSQLATAKNEDEADTAYWQLDNNCVVQGQLFNSSPSLVPALLAGLATQLPKFVSMRFADLLAEIVCGESDESEIAEGEGDLGHRARNEAASGLWLIYRLATDSGLLLQERGLIIAHAVDPDRCRVRLLLESARHDADRRVAHLAEQLLR